MSPPDGLFRLRIALVVLGTLVWVPYLVLEYGMGRDVSTLPVLAVHVPCMLGALGLRIYGWMREKKKGGG